MLDKLDGDRPPPVVAYLRYQPRWQPHKTKKRFEFVLS